MYLAELFPPKPVGPRAEKPLGEGDWCCPKCHDVQWARNAFCRRCGMQKPLDPHAAACVKDLAEKGYFEGGPQKAGMAGDWTCPKCYELVFANRPLCRRCHAPRPEGMAAELANHEAMAGTPSNEIVTGYVAPGAVAASSSWTKQWDAGSMVGMFWGRDVPEWVVPGGLPGSSTSSAPAEEKPLLAITGGGKKPASSSSSSSGDEKARKRRKKSEKEEPTAKPAAKPTADAETEKEKREKQDRKEAKEKRKQERAAKEQEQRRLMRERRQQKRTIVIEDKRTIVIED
mmetsp:Transcript_55501/g.125091  ORF Transcript_55501/g.125091 Transcript_55501/m.125091 type:complete len:287 (-) Transcript_55501:107-967(-)